MSDHYDQGYIDGLTCFAYWQNGMQFVTDGIEFVGTSGTTLKTAIAERKTLHNYAPPADGQTTVNQDLLAACQAQHGAIDRLFALLIEATYHTDCKFLPSESGQPWQACELGYAAIQRAGGNVSYD